MRRLSWARTRFSSTSSCACARAPRMASSVISWKTIRRTGTLGLSSCLRCQLIDSPSRSGSVARMTSEASLTASLSGLDVLLLVRRHDVVRREVAVGVHAQPAPGLGLDGRGHLAGGFRQVADVSVTGLDAVVAAKEAGQGPGLGGRLDDDQRLRHGCPGGSEPPTLARGSEIPRNGRRQRAGSRPRSRARPAGRRPGRRPAGGGAHVIGVELVNRRIEAEFGGHGGIERRARGHPRPGWPSRAPP